MSGWLWVLLGCLSGEVHEYMSDKKYEIYDPNRKLTFKAMHKYHADYKKFMFPLSIKELEKCKFK